MNLTNYKILYLLWLTAIILCILVIILNADRIDREPLTVIIPLGCLTIFSYIGIRKITYSNDK